MDNIYLLTFRGGTIQEHEATLQWCLEVLKQEKFYIGQIKTQFFAIRFTCLGHYCDENGIRASADKLKLIDRWPRPDSYLDVQQFLGLIEYIS